MGLPAYIKVDGDVVYYNGDGHLIYFIPEDYFERGVAELNGEYVKIFGEFNYCAYSKSGAPIDGLKLTNYANNFICLPGEIIKKTGIKLTKNSDVKDYVYLKFSKGDKLIVSVNTPKLIENVQDFMRMFIGAVLPDEIPYDKKHLLFLENVEYNDYSYKMPASAFGILVAETCRSKSDIQIPFRLSGSKDMTDYKSVNIKELPNLVSAFTAVTSENWNESISNALVNKKHTDSPLEKLFVE